MKVLESRVGGLTPMSGINQVVATIEMNDGIVDDDSSVVSYYLFNSAKILRIILVEMITSTEMGML